MDTTELIFTIQGDPGLRRRIEAIVRNARWNDANADVRGRVPIDDLAWAVASNSTVRATVAAFGGVGDTVADALETVPDGDLEYVVLTVALPRVTSA